MRLLSSSPSKARPAPLLCFPRYAASGELYMGDGDAGNDDEEDAKELSSVLDDGIEYCSDGVDMGEDA